MFIEYCLHYRNVLSYTVEESRNIEKLVITILIDINCVNRNLPRGILIGLPIVIVCYLFVNIAYFAGLSKSEMLSSTATALVK